MRQKFQVNKVMSLLIHLFIHSIIFLINYYNNISMVSTLLVLPVFKVLIYICTLLVLSYTKHSITLGGSCYYSHLKDEEIIV